MAFEQNDCFGELGLSLKLCVLNECKICERQFRCVCVLVRATKRKQNKNKNKNEQRPHTHSVTNNQYSDFGGCTRGLCMCVLSAMIFGVDLAATVLAAAAATTAAVRLVYCYSKTKR